MGTRLVLQDKTLTNRHLYYRCIERFIRCTNGEFLSAQVHRSVRVTRGGGGRGVDLLHQGQLVPVVPALDDFAFLDTHHGGAGDSNLFVRGGHSEMVAGVRHHRGPADGDLVVRAERLFDLDLNIRERTAKAIVEHLEFSGAPENLGLQVRSVTRPVLVHKLVDRLDAAFVPRFLEPAPHENHVFFDGHAVPPPVGAECYILLLMYLSAIIVAERNNRTTKPDGAGREERSLGGHEPPASG